MGKKKITFFKKDRKSPENASIADPHIKIHLRRNILALRCGQKNGGYEKDVHGDAISGNRDPRA
jgi:hypothetical protein